MKAIDRMALGVVACSFAAALSSASDCCAPVTTVTWGSETPGGTCDSAYDVRVCAGTATGGSLAFGLPVVRWCYRIYWNHTDGRFISGPCNSPPPGWQHIDPLDFTDPCCFYNPQHSVIIIYSSGTYKPCNDQPCNSTPVPPEA